MSERVTALPRIPFAASLGLKRRLRAEPGTDAGDVDIDVASIDAYRAVLDEARRRYFASEDEREEPLGG